MNYLTEIQARIDANNKELESLKAERDEAIAASVAEGCSHREIRKVTGLSSQRVGQIVKEQLWANERIASMQTIGPPRKAPDFDLDTSNFTPEQLAQLAAYQNAG